MTTKTPLLATATLAAALAMPVGAQAAGSLFTKPVKVKSYDMTISATDGSPDTLGISFLRTSGKSTQMHSYTFNQGVKVTAKSISASLGKYGNVKLKLGATKSVKGTVPKGCTGSVGKVKSGTLTGDFKFVADATYFKTIKRKKFSGSVISGKSTVKCDGDNGGDGNGGGTTAGPRLALTNAGSGGGSFSFTATPQLQQAFKSDDPAITAPASIFHMINTSGTGLTNITASAATVPGLAPFFTGQGDFTGESVGTMAIGTLGGSLVAKFDSIGDAPLAGDAMLMQQ